MKETKEITAEEAISYRTPLRVTEILLLPYGAAFPVCPKCKRTLEREYQSYCDRCGQHLEWKKFSKAKLVEWQPKD